MNKEPKGPCRNCGRKMVAPEGERRRAALTVCRLAADRNTAALVLDTLGLLDAEPPKVPATAGEGRWN